MLIKELEVLGFNSLTITTWKSQIESIKNAMRDLDPEGKKKEKDGKPA
jgi:hypothetical protein